MMLLFLLLVTAFGCQQEEVEFKQSIEPESQTTEVTQDLAVNLAKRFSVTQLSLNKKNPSKTIQNSDLKFGKPIKKTQTIIDRNEKVALYIINFEPEGFVIVSGTKKEVPILAFSENGSIGDFVLENKEHPFQSWVKNRKGKIETLRQKKSSNIEGSIKEQWDYAAPPIDDEETRTETSTEQEGPLLLTEWNQGAGYNNECPDLTCVETFNGRAWTGCVATAVAQVMKYWEHPSTFNWSQMPNTTGSQETSVLMRDIGDAVNMQYGCEASGASTSDAVGALIQNYGYSSNVSYVDYVEATAINKIKQGWPIILRGDGTGGHAWVTDGYKRNKITTIHNPGTVYEYETSSYSSTYLSMNWGWGGNSNGWFLNDDFTPGGSDYSNNNKMIINIHP